MVETSPPPEPTTKFHSSEVVLVFWFSLLVWGVIALAAALLGGLIGAGVGAIAWGWESIFSCAFAGAAIAASLVTIIIALFVMWSCIRQIPPKFEWVLVFFILFWGGFPGSFVGGITGSLISGWPGFTFGSLIGVGGGSGLASFT